MAMRRDRVRADRRANMMKFRVDGTVGETELKLRLYSWVWIGGKNFRPERNATATPAFRDRLVYIRLSTE